MALRRGTDPTLSRLLRTRGREVANELLEAAVWHGVAPLVHRRLGGDRDLLPADVARRFEDLHAITTLRNLAMRTQLDDVLARIDDGTPVAVLKGAHLALRVYSDPGVRDMNDIDLLLRPEAAGHLQNRLLEAGFATRREWERENPGHHLPRLERPGSHDVEVHTGLVPRDAPFRVDLDALWARMESTNYGGRMVAHLAPDDALLHLCTHTAFDHNFLTALQGLCDVDAIVAATGSRIQWDRLVSTARTDRRAPFAFVALTLAADLLGTPVPASTLGDLRTGPTDDEIVAVAREYLLDRSEMLPTGFVRIRSATTWRGRAAEVLGSLFPPGDEMRRIHGPQTKGPLLLARQLIRPFELLVRRGRLVVGLFTGRGQNGPLLEKDARARRLRRWAERVEVFPQSPDPHGSWAGHSPPRSE